MSCFSKTVYSLAFIYNITNGTDNYIGSTELTLEERLKKHKWNYKSYLESKSNYNTSFDIIEKGNYRIELLEECNINTKYELRVIEGSYQEEMDCVNKYTAGLTSNETKKKYYEKNKQKINEKNKEKFNCNCGGKYLLPHKARHLKTKRHINYIE